MADFEEEMYKDHVQERENRRNHAELDAYYYQIEKFIKEHYPERLSILDHPLQVALQILKEFHERKV